jgi:hypothetical protein|mmetsp:Transcript_36556/g.47981  ORF Transcript_36556/g.47981 Transcript_36556/m.47981 type:complete len:85 (+) Transcript_36556:1742-1996(+)
MPDSFSNEIAVKGLTSSVKLDAGALGFTNDLGFVVQLYVNAVDENLNELLDAELTVTLSDSDASSGAEGLIKSFMSTVCALAAI